MFLPRFCLFGEKQCALWIKEGEIQISQSLFYVSRLCSYHLLFTACFPQ